MNTTYTQVNNEEIVSIAKLTYLSLIPVIFLIFMPYIAFFVLIYRIIYILSNEFVLTQKRIYGKVGIFNRMQIDIVLPRIQSVVTKQSIIGRICNYGTIIVNSSAGQHEIKFVKNPDIFRDNILDTMDKFGSLVK